MKQAKIMGIKEILKKYGKLTSSQFAALHKQLIDAVRLPKVKLKGPDKAKAGDTLSVEIEDCRLPLVDLYENKLKDQKADLDIQKLPVTFEGTERPITVQGDYAKNSGLLNVVVPRGAMDGHVTIQFPIKEHLGPISIIDQIDSDDPILMSEIKKWVPDRQVVEKCRCDCPDSEIQEVLDIERVIYLPSTIFRLSLRCLGWYETCSICPYGAIKFDERNRCYVDIDICRGQSYETVGFYERNNETTCWECFTGDEYADELHSRRCLQRRLKKVLHVDSRCCAFCTPAARLVDNLSLMDLCPNAAISIQSSTFVVDPSLCTGCMVCYNGINCFYNDEEEISARAMRMVSHIKR